MARGRLYVARSGSATIVARRRPWAPASRVIRRRRFAVLVERAPATTAQESWSATDAAVVFLPPLFVFGIVAGFFGGPFLGFAAGCAVFFLMAYLSPAFRRRGDHELTTDDSAERRVLTQSTGREVFGRALDSADRISETWPSLESLVPTAEAQAMLADALWDLAGVLVKAERLHKVLVELSRPEFAQRSAGDDTAREVEAQRRATRAALVDLNQEVARRVTSIRRAEDAGMAFIREKEMRRVIVEAEESLRHLRDDSGLAGTGRSAAPDTGAELAEHTQSVLEAYRELNRYRPQII